MKRILVAEDNPANRELIREVLEMRGYEVIEAHDGKEALDKLIESRPDLAILDIQMPHMDGLALVRAIRDHPDLRSLPVMALTAYAMQTDRQRTLDAGFDSYLTKPFDIAVLAGEVKRLLEY